VRESNITSGCGHRLCERIGGTCSLAITRSRGCRPNLTSREVAPEVIDEVRELVAHIDDHAAAVQLARIVRREAMDDRNLVAIARSDGLDFADQLTELCARRSS
jgi:hypothetical protein